MYRWAAAKRLLSHSQSSLYYTTRARIQSSSSPSCIPTLTRNTSRFLSSATSSDPFPNQNPNNAFGAASSSTTEEERSHGGNTNTSRRTPPGAHYQDEQARVLNASLHHVIRLGWTEAAMIAGAREVGVSPSIVGSFPGKEAALVEFFMDECLSRLVDFIDLGEDLKNMVPSERIAKLVRVRLEMQAPYISKWPQALSIQAQPSNFPASLKQRAMLVDEIWHASGDEGGDVDWYVKRTILGGIYSTTEVYMLTDNSPDFRETWAFLNNRVRDAFDLKKTVQEVKYLAEAVGAGMGSTLQGFMKKVF